MKKKKMPIIPKITGGMFNNVTQTLSTDMLELIKNKFIYTVSVDNIKWHINYSIRKYVKTNDEAVFNSSDELTIEAALLDGSITYNSLIEYKGIPILIKSQQDPTKNSDDGKGNGKRTYSSMVFKTLNIPRHKKMLIKFIKHLIRENEKISLERFNQEHLVATGSGYGYRTKSNIAMRSFDNIFLPKKIEDSIKESLDSFRNKRDWYIEHNIPYHFGIILYGEPGTGKSITAQAIAHYLKGKMHVFTADSLTVLSNTILNGSLEHSSDLFNDRYHVLLVEDIDCSMKTSKRTYIDSTNRNNTGYLDDGPGLATILNLMDGIGAPQNTIYIFTTNHIDKLDPALIRPGRIDLSIEVPGVNQETLNEFMLKYYNKGLEREVNIPNKLTFASLQVEVMKGKTFDELIEYIEKGNN